MHRCQRFAAHLLVLGILLGLSAAAHGQLPTRRTPAPELTKQTLFSIPFFLNQSAPPPAEVHLYVSGDEGRSWSLYQRRQPHQARFDFQAGQDGQYWFVVRTNEDREQPTAATMPEKVVIVDRSPPEFALEVGVGPSGEIVARYRAEDANLDTASLRLEYRRADGEPWEPIAVDRSLPLPPQDTTQLRGETSWIVDPAARIVTIRGEVADRAGNRRELTRPLELPLPSLPGPTQSPAPLTQTLPVPPAAVEEPAAAVDAVPPPVSRLPSSDSAWSSATPRSTAATPRSGASSIPASPVEEDRLPWLTDPVAEPGPGPPDDWQVGRPTFPADPVATPEPLAPTAIFPTPTATSTPTATPPTTGTRSEPAVGSPPPATGGWTSQRSSVPPPDDYAPPVANRVEPTQPPVRPEVQMTNSRRFNLDYDVAGSGPDGVARVELWITENEGNSWQPYGIDRDLQSPFLVTLDREGIYGFRLLIHNQDGRSARPPQPGDEADLWIGLDWTPPQAALRRAEIRRTAERELVEIQWHAEDAFLIELPIRLSYAPSPEGPWTSVAEDLANTGTYTWFPGQTLPARIYLRMEVRDRAGNVTTEALATPIGAAAGGPKGIIRGIRPATEEPTARE